MKTVSHFVHQNSRSSGVGDDSGVKKQKLWVATGRYSLGDLKGKCV